MAKLHYAARRASLPVDICSTFPNPSCYHPETAVLQGHTYLLYLLPVLMLLSQQSRRIQINYHHWCLNLHS